MSILVDVCGWDREKEKGGGNEKDGEEAGKEQRGYVNFFSFFF